MQPRLALLLSSFALLPLVMGCGSDEGGDTAAKPGTDAGPDVADTDAAPDAEPDAVEAGPDAPPPPDPICVTPGAGPYPLVFTEVTAELGLGPDDLNITATGVTVADIDGDHWPDLTVTMGQSTRDDPADSKNRFRLLRNMAGTAFEDLTWTSGLFDARDGTPGRATTYVIYGDVDNDGDVDAFSVVYQDADKTELVDFTSLMLNDGTGHFTHGPDRAFTSGAYDPLASAAFLDFDRDGVLDIFTGHQYGQYGVLSSTIQDSMFKGDGAGGFDDVTDAVGLTTQKALTSTLSDGTAHKPTWGVAACDLDGDGWSDLLTASYGRQFNALYRNAQGMFEDLSQVSAFAHDDNEDYTDNHMYACFCEAHPTNAACAGAPPAAGGCAGWENYWNVGSDDKPWRLGGNSSNSLCGDLDNDGDLDVVAVELRHGWAGSSSDRTELLRNDGFPATPFVRPGNDETGLARSFGINSNEGDLGGALGDLDNDGKLDVLIASSDYPLTYSHIFQQQADGTFLNVSEEAGSRLPRAHGLALVDFDRDGDYDLVWGTSLARWAATDYPKPPDAAYVHVLRNDTGQSANRLMIHLVGGEGTNLGAVGARVSVHAGGGTFVREQQSGYGLTGFQHDALMIIGLGDTCVADDLEVRWPNAAGDVDTFHDVPANYVLVIEQGKWISYQTLDEYAAR